MKKEFKNTFMGGKERYEESKRIEQRQEEMEEIFDTFKFQLKNGELEPVLVVLFWKQEANKEIAERECFN